MIIRNGITSFFRSKPISEFTFNDFKKIVFDAARQFGFTVLNCSESGVTPNFHIAALECRKEFLSVLGHNIYPIIAFAEPLSTQSCELHFRDADAFSRRLIEMYPHVTIATAAELNRRIDSTDFEQLNRAELEQIKYWKPQTIGELAFNWWD